MEESYRWIAISAMVAILLPIMLLSILTYLNGDATTQDPLTWDEQRTVWEQDIRDNYAASEGGLFTSWDFLADSPLSIFLKAFQNDTNPEQDVTVIGQLYLYALNIVNFTSGWFFDITWVYISALFGTESILTNLGIPTYIYAIIACLYIIIPILIIIKHLPTT